MGREEVWKTLADLITEFRKRGEDIPTGIMEDLRAAKTMLQVHKADPNRVENIPSIETYLGNIESNLIMKANEKFGADFAEQWLKKLEQAERTATKFEDLESTSKFVAGLPKGQQWIRLQISDETPEGEIRKLAEESGLFCKRQPDRYLLVYGESEKLKQLVKKTADKFKGGKNPSYLNCA